MSFQIPSEYGIIRPDEHPYRAPDQQAPVDPAALLAALTVDPDPPSLTTQQIWQFSKQFRDQSACLCYLWRLCFDAVSGWRAYTQADSRARYGQEVQWFNRARDQSYDITCPKYRTISAALSMVLPVWDADPATESPADIATAQADKMALRYIWRQAELEDVFDEAKNIGIIAGTSATLTYMDGENVAEEVFTPERIRAEPGIGSPDKSRFLAVTRITTKDVLKKRYPDKADLIDTAPRPEQFSPSSDGWTALPIDRIEVLEAYCRSGHWYLMIGPNPEHVLAKGKTPDNCMPIGIHRYNPIPGEFWGSGAVEKILPWQYLFNQSHNQIQKNARLTNNPKILYDRLSRLDPNAFTAQAGEKVGYDGGRKPEYMALQPMSQYAVQLPAVALAGAGTSTGSHGVSDGSREVGVVTGAAVTAMTNNDKAQFEVTKRDLKKLVRRKARVFILYVKAYYPESKVINMFDRYGTGEFEGLTASHLSENPNVFFEADSLFADDIVARQTRIMQLVQQGFISKELAIAALRNGTDPLYNAKPVQDYKEAKDALDRVIQLGYEVVDRRKPPTPDPMTGQMIPTTRKVVTLYASDNFQIFADVTKSFMRSEKFYALDIDRQDEIEKYYLDLLDKLAPPPMPGAPGAPPQLKSVPQLPSPAAPPSAKSLPNQAAPTPEHKAAIAGDKAEAA